MLMVISKSKGDQEWGCWFEENPFDHMLNCTNKYVPECHVEVLDQEAVLQQMEMILQRMLLHHDTRAFNESRVSKVIQQARELLGRDSGTIIISLGVRNEELKEQLKESDTFSHNSRNHNRQSYLNWFIRFKTILGHPFYRAALDRGGFKITDHSLKTDLD